MRPRQIWIAGLSLVLIGCEMPKPEPPPRKEPPPPAPADWDIPIVVNPAVGRWLQYYGGQGRESLEIALTRAGRYERVMREIFRRKGLPEDLIYVSLIESGFRPTAYSRARAAGLWQFVPGTARIYGLEMTHWVDERLDPIAATEAAAEYLEDLQREFRDWYLTLAAYNAGPGRVHRAIRRTGSRDYWVLAERRALRWETRNYVPKLIAVALIAKLPGEYGVRARPEPIATFDIRYVPDATSLDVVAEAAGVSFEQIHELNLHLIRGVTPPGERYGIRLPAGTARLFAEAYAKLPPSARVRSVVHVVRWGENLERIARIYGSRVSAIREVNDGIHPRSLKVGQRLLVPEVRSLPGFAD